MILYLKDSKNSTHKLLDTINSYGRVHHQLTKIISFSIYHNKQTEKEYMETIPFTAASKKSNT
jgi:hypothetical protein